MAPSTEQRESVFTLTGDDLAEYITRHKARWGVPPMAGGAPEDGEGEAEETDTDETAEGVTDEAGDEADDDQEDDDAISGDDSWREKSRKHERAAKREANARAKAEAELAELKKGKQTAEQKAISEAVEKAKAEARAEAQTELRNTRLEAAVGRSADKFADPDDALHQIEIALKKGTIDEEDIFTDDGKVKTAEVEKALKDILKRKPHLAAAEGGARFKGGSDARKGAAPKGGPSTSVEDHFKAIRRTK